jgi:hypothetical protein
MWLPIYKRTSGIFCVSSKNIFGGTSKGGQPQKSGILKFSQYCVVGSLNLSLKEPDSLQKISAQSDYPALRKRPKRRFKVVKEEIFTTVEHHTVEQVDDDVPDYGAEMVYSD